MLKSNSQPGPGRKRVPQLDPDRTGDVPGRELEPVSAVHHFALRQPFGEAVGVELGYIRHDDRSGIGPVDGRHMRVVVRIGREAAELRGDEGVDRVETNRAGSRPSPVRWSTSIAPPRRRCRTIPRRGSERRRPRRGAPPAGAMSRTAGGPAGRRTRSPSRSDRPAAPTSRLPPLKTACGSSSIRIEV